MARYLRQATVATVKVGPLVNPADGITPYTAGGFTAKVGANGAAAAARHDATAVAHDADGFYAVELDATDTATVGRLKLEVPGSAGNYLPAWDDFTVLAPAVYDVLFGTVAPSTYAGADTAGTATLLGRLGSALTIAGGKVAATVASGDGADAAGVKATIGAAGAGLTSIPYTGPSAGTIQSGLATSSALASLATTVGVAGAGLTAVPYTGPPALTDYQQRGVAATMPAGGVTLASSQPNYAPALAGSAPTWFPSHLTNATFASDGVFAVAALANAPTGSGGGGSVDFAAMETYFAANGGLSSNTIAIAGSGQAGTNLKNDELASPPTIPSAADNAAATWGYNGGRTLSAFGFMVTLADASVTSAKFTVGTINAAATGILERLMLLVSRFFPAAGGSVTVPKSGNGNLVVKATGGATIATQPVTDDGTTQSLGAAS